jgi:hypothetical protein
MATYQINSTGSPSVPYSCSAISPINVFQSNSQTVGVNGDFELAATNIENCYKTLPEFIQQDQARNRTWTTTPISEEFATLTVDFTITNAVVSVPFSVTTDLTGDALTAYLQEQADQTISAFKSQWGWVDL